MSAPRRIVILGGGFAGAALAVHLLECARGPLDLVVVEPRARLGQGLAYGTAVAAHRINVPSDKMILHRDRPDHFTQWLERTGLRALDPEGQDGHGHHYSRRQDFGAYMAATVDAAAQVAGAARLTLSPGDVLPEATGARLIHLRARAEGVTPSPTGARVLLAGGSSVDGWRVVLATGHERPQLPWRIEGGSALDPRLISDPWAADALAGVAQDARVVLLGTGLTMVDVAAQLLEAGHTGPITAISRRAQLPRQHGAFEPLAKLGPLPATALAGLRAARQLVASERASGRDWHTAIDSLRAQASAIWQGWGSAEQARFLARLRPFWDVHRFRIAPQLASRIDTARASGALRVQRGQITGLRARPEALEILTPAGPVAADAVVCCIGPHPDITRRPDPLIVSLLREGHAQSDPHRLGLAVTRRLELAGRRGANTALRVVGPLTRGVVWEVVGVPELSDQCRILADMLSAEAVEHDLPATASRTHDHISALVKETP